MLQTKIVSFSTNYSILFNQVNYLIYYIQYEKGNNLLKASPSKNLWNTLVWYDFITFNKTKNCSKILQCNILNEL